jgi:hypothetical protein
MRKRGMSRYIFEEEDDEDDEQELRRQQLIQEAGCWRNVT